MKIPIVFAFDNNLIMPAGVCITSLLKNALPDTFYDIFILHPEGCDFSKTKLSDLQRVFSNCRITFREVCNEFLGAFEIRGITTPAYYRLLIPELITEYSKVLYSDVDVIFRDDLTNFYDTDLTGYYMAGVDNGSALRPSVQKYVKEKLGVDCKYGHYYSGNLIINSELILKDGLTKKFRQFAKADFHQQDMDIINIVCYGKIKPLSPAFCLTNYLIDIIINRKTELLNYFTSNELEYAMKKGIVHYNGPKPWKTNCLNMDLWWSDYRESLWYDEKLCYDFFLNLQNRLDRMTLKERIKNLVRYFIYGRSK